MQIGDLTVKITASIAEFNSKMASVKSSLGGLKSTATGVGKAGAKAIGLISASLGLIEGAVGLVGVRYDAMQEQSSIAWETILGSQKDAIKTLATLQQMGAKTPFEFEGLDKSAKMLYMAGYNGKDLFKTLTAVGDAVSAIGGNDDVLQGVSMAIFQMASKGKISAEEMNQLAERGIPAWKIISDQMGIPVQQLMKMSQNGKLFAKDVLPLLTKGMEDSFGGSMQKQSSTFNGMLSTIKDNTKQLLGLLAKPLFEKLKSGMKTVIPLLNGFMDLAQGDMKGFQKALEDVFGSKVAGYIVGFFKTLGDTFSAFKDGFTNGFSVMQTPLETFASALGGRFKFIVDGFKKLLTYLPTIIDGVKGFIDGVIQAWQKLFSGKNNMANSFTSIFNTIKSIALPILKDVISFIKGILAQLSQFWKENGDQIIQAVKNFWAIIATIFKILAPVIKFIIEDVWNSIKGIISGAIKIIMGIIKVFAGLFTGDFGKMWEGIKDIFFGAVKAVWNFLNLLFIGKILGGIKLLWKGGVALVKAFGEDIIKFFKAIWDNSGEIFSKMVHGIVDFFKWLWDGLVNIVKGIFDGVTGFFKNIWTSLTTIANNIWKGITGAFTSMKDTVFGAVKGMYDKCIGIWGKIFDTASSIFGKIKTAITHPIETAKGIISGIVDKIKGIFNALHIKFPHINLPHLSIEWKHTKLGHIPYPSFHLKWYAKGGIFNGPSMIGVGERGPEAVVPLQGSRMKPFAKAIARDLDLFKGRGGEITNHFTVYATVREEADIQKIARELHGLQERNRRQGGR